MPLLSQAIRNYFLTISFYQHSTTFFRFKNRKLRIYLILMTFLFPFMLLLPLATATLPPALGPLDEAAFLTGADLTGAAAGAAALANGLTNEEAAFAAAGAAFVAVTRAAFAVTGAATFLGALVLTALEPKLKEGREGILNSTFLATGFAFTAAFLGTGTGAVVA
jgi:hypothetical protein